MVQPSTTAGRRERKKQQMREHIYGAARDLFLRHGFETTTVEQISETADVAPATFFNHFHSKQALLAEMSSEVFDRLQALIDEQLTAPGTASERIVAFADRAADEIEASRARAHDVLLGLIRATARHGEIAPYLSRAQEPFTAIIRNGQGRGEVRTDRHARFLAEMVIGAFNMAVINWMNDSDYPLEARLREAASFVTEAIAPPAEKERT